MKFLFVFTLLPQLAFAFTLNNSIGAHFKDDKVTVRVGINPTPCSNVDLEEVSGLLNEAMNDYWNIAPTSSLQLDTAGSFDTGDDDYRTGELCLIGGSCAGTPVPGPSDIVVTCNSNATNFPGGSSLLALTLPNVIKGKDIKGAVVLINDANNSFDLLSRDKKIAVIAHEVGHAIGLGHSDERAALMYYAVVPTRNSLGRDDIMGVTYLYPEQGDLYGAGCFLGTIATMKDSDDDKGNGGGPPTFWPTAFFGLVLALMMKRTKKWPEANFRV